MKEKGNVTRNSRPEPTLADPTDTSQYRLQQRRNYVQFGVKTGGSIPKPCQSQSRCRHYGIFREPIPDDFDTFATQTCYFVHPGDICPWAIWANPAIDARLTGTTNLKMSAGLGGRTYRYSNMNRRTCPYCHLYNSYGNGMTPATTMCGPCCRRRSPNSKKSLRRHWHATAKARQS